MVDGARAESRPPGLHRRTRSPPIRANEIGGVPGIWLSAQHPFLAGSPDGVLYETVEARPIEHGGVYYRCRRSLIEIKTPWKLRTRAPGADFYPPCHQKNGRYNAIPCSYYGMGHAALGPCPASRPNPGKCAPRRGPWFGPRHTSAAIHGSGVHLLCRAFPDRYSGHC